MGVTSIFAASQEPTSSVPNDRQRIANNIANRVANRVIESGIAEASIRDVNTRAANHGGIDPHVVSILERVMSEAGTGDYVKSNRLYKFRDIFEELLNEGVNKDGILKDTSDGGYPCLKRPVVQHNSLESVIDSLLFNGEQEEKKVLYDLLIKNITDSVKRKEFINTYQAFLLAREKKLVE